MVGTISPVVYRNSPYGQKGWLAAAAVYSLASAAGGTFAGLLASSMGRLLSQGDGRWQGLSPLLIGVAATIYSIHELKLVSLPFLERKRQVPSIWRHRYHPYVTAGLFGLLLGAGFTTFIPTSTYHIVTLSTFLQASPKIGMIVMGAFGLARASLLWPSAHLATSIARLEGLTQYMDLTKPLMRQVNGFALAMFGANSLLRVLLSEQLSFT